MAEKHSTGAPGSDPATASRPPGLPAEVAYEVHELAEEYVGTRAALVEAGIAEAAWFPGEPGQCKTSGRGKRDGRDVRIYRRRKLFVIYVDWTPQQRRLRDEQARLHKARQVEAQMLALLPSSADDFREKAVRVLERCAKDASYLSDACALSGGYRFTPETIAEYEAALASAIQVLLELVTETLRAALNDLAGVAPGWLRAVAWPEWFGRYAKRAEDWRLPGGSKQERAAFAQQVGTDGFALLDAIGQPLAPPAARSAPTLAALRTVWQTHFERRAGGPPCWRDGAELPPVGERIQSPYDAQMHYSTKRGLEWSGYKVHVTETCDDDAARVITHVETRPAMEIDMSATAAIHARLAARGLLPAEHFVDSGYVNAELLAASRRRHGVSLEGPVRGLAQALSKAGTGYDQAHFAVDWQRQQVTCPQGKVSVGWTPRRDEKGRPRIHVRFGRGDCGSCAVRPLCTSSREARRVVYLQPREQYEALNAARARMHDAAWKKRYRIRAGVEGTLSQGVRAFGMRRSRYIGLAKTSLQQVCIAVGMNVSRVMHWLGERAHAKTRISRFARLAPRPS